MTAWVTSATVPRRRTGSASASFASRSEPFGMMPQKLSVRMGPGATTLAVMPSGPSSSAQVRTMPCTADFEAE